jgi:alpha-N-arabinofuranosidase
MNLPITRRHFARTAGATLFSVITTRKGVGWQSREQKLEIDAGATIGTIQPELHSHFAEHLGSCTYGGLWVGRNSRVPNVNGYRKAAVDYLKALGIPVLRWPGGCFADDYHWRDGIGPVERRPKTVNIHWGNYTEDNSFGTHEFIGLCRAIGAEPYLAANVGSGTPQEMRDWIEYCNYPAGSTLSDERARNGSPEPFNVRYWGVGNENWGCGGNMTPQQYALQYRQFRTYVRVFGSTRPFAIACGPSGNNKDWTRGFFETVGRGLPQGYAMHYYSNGRLEATKFTPEETARQLSSFALVEQAILEQRELMNTWDPQKRVGLMVDEWGIWDRMVPEEQKRFGRLWQQIPIRGGVAAALGLNVFHRQADKLVMCNIAQTVNVLHSMLLTDDGPNCIRTPAYWAFYLMKEHRGKTAVKSDTGDTSPLGLSVSASRSEQEMMVTLVNPKHDAGMKVSCGLAGVKASGAAAQLLHHPDLNACNTFEQPDAIAPRPQPATLAGGRLEVELPPLSVATVKLKLG